MIMLPCLSNELAHIEQVAMGTVNQIQPKVSSTTSLTVVVRSPARFPHPAIGIYIFSEWGSDPFRQNRRKGQCPNHPLFCIMHFLAINEEGKENFLLLSTCFWVSYFNGIVNFHTQHKYRYKNQQDSGHQPEGM